MFHAIFLVLSRLYDLIIECRRVLKWTYAYGFYLAEHEHAKKQFFEYLQGEAESGLERLHQCAEKELQVFLNGDGPSKDFNDFRTKLAGLTSVTRNYFENLVRELENGLCDVDSNGAASSKATGSKNAAGSSKGRGGRGKGTVRASMSSRITDDNHWSCEQCTYANVRSATACQIVFTREGNDLVATQKISLAEALSGCTVNLTTLDGRNLTIIVNNVVHPEYEEVVPREGMPLPKDPTKKGNLRIKFNIKFPPRLNADQKSGLKKAGFRYHHAESDYLMLVYWIPHTPDSIPANASHRLGVGAFVVNNKREVLVVQETSGRFGGTGVWKMPTGAVNEGEDICDAVIREVKEETGVETEFVEVLAFRQSHKSFFQKSDLFFVCMLQPQSFDIQSQASEIEATKWMPVEDYAAQPFVQENELFDFIAKICLSKLNDNYTGFSNVPTTTSSGKKTYLYLNNDAIGSHLLASKEKA
ncbi:unnamed protein product [Vicia faba]|uniref:Nudix hydrolase domain-containing protein n=1 Tax=Vicia faba TaxID=3906 RepID=A0AAV1A029_VICFA|nr:unnamed protein product [Vicia faba]